MQNLLSNILIDSKGVIYWVENRELTLNDVDVKDWEVNSWGSPIHAYNATLTLTLKSELQQPILDFSSAVSSYRRYCDNHCYPLNHIISSKIFERVSISYRGYKTDKTKQIKATQILTGFESQLNIKKDSYILTCLQNFNKMLNDLVNKIKNEYIEKMIRIHTSFSNFDLDDLDKEAGTRPLRLRIEKLKKQLVGLEKDRYSKLEGLLREDWENDKDAPIEVRQAILNHINEHGFKTGTRRCIY